MKSLRISASESQNLRAAVAGMVLISFGLPFPVRGEETKPCQNIRTACEAGGFTKGGHRNGQNKGLYRDCLQKILAGESVAGVTVSTDVVSACKAKKEKRPASKAENTPTS